jgi:hypothetical protein
MIKNQGHFKRNKKCFSSSPISFFATESIRIYSCNYHVIACDALPLQLRLTLPVQWRSVSEIMIYLMLHEQ